MKEHIPILENKFRNVDAKIHPDEDSDEGMINTMKYIQIKQAYEYDIKEEYIIDFCHQVTQGIGWKYKDKPVIFTEEDKQHYKAYQEYLKEEEYNEKRDKRNNAIDDVLNDDE